jgi:GAF domain-containing protein
MAAHTTAEVSMGLRLATAGSSIPLSPGQVASVLGQVRSRTDLNEAVTLIERLLHADDVTVSRVIAGERCVETLTENRGVRPGARYSYDDFPTTEHVIVKQVVGQLVVDDPASDPAERALLAELGFAALLMAPVISRGETIGLLEVSRESGRPWTSAETDRARLLAQSLAAALRVDAGVETLPWTPATFGTSVRR